jgi:hypothetical protein
MASRREPVKVSRNDEEDAQAGRRSHHDRFSQKRTALWPPHADENRPRRFDQADGHQRLTKEHSFLPYQYFLVFLPKSL